MAEASQPMKVENSNPRAPIRVGVIVTEGAVGAHETIERLKGVEYLELAVVMLLRPPATAQRQGRPPLLFCLWKRLDRWFGGSDGRRSDLLNVIAALGVNADHNQTLCPADIARIRAQQLDVLVHLGAGRLAPDVAACAKFGVWSCSYDGFRGDDVDIQIFWNIYAGRRTHDVALQATASNHAPRLLLDSTLRSDVFSLTRNEKDFSKRQSLMLLKGLRRLWTGGWENIAATRSEVRLPRAVTVRELPAARTMLCFAIRWGGRALLHLARRYTTREQWFIVCHSSKGSAPRGTDPSSNPNGVAILIPPPLGNYADPFLVERNGRTYLFFEQYSGTTRGTIVCSEVSADGVPGEPREVLARNYHLSYPFVFEWRGETYLMPETWANRTVEVYRAMEFPWQWEFAAVLLNNITAVDPTIVEYKDKLWLFVGGVAGLGTESSELSVFYSDSLFGEWHSHPKNPVVCDVRRARPAGKLFFDNGSLIRPGQDCAERYGRGVTLSRIEKLSENEYHEVAFATIGPDFIPGICAIHTLNGCGHLQVVDARARVPWYVDLRRNAFQPRMPVVRPWTTPWPAHQTHV